MVAAALDGDGIDLGQQLVAKVVKVYADWRKARGEVEYNNGAILVKSTRPVDILRDRAMIEEHHVHAATQLIMLREIAFSRLDIATRRDYAHWIDWCESTPSKHAETLYIRVMRVLPKWQSALAERLCFQPVHDGDYAWIYERQASVRSAFDAVGEALIVERKRLKDQLDAENSVDTCEKNL